MRRFLLLAPLLATAVLAACSTTAVEEPTTAAESTLVTGAVCATLDYGPRPADPNQTYRFFANDEQVKANITQLLQFGILAGAVGPSATLKSVNGDARAVRLVAEVFAGFKRAFPLETTGLDKAPPVAVIQSPLVNAFALAATFENFALTPKSPWFFIVNSGLLDHGNTDDELRAVFAHEIGHLVLQTFQPVVQARVRHAYTLGTGSEDGILGAAQSDDASLAPQIGRLLGGQSRVGAVSQLGLNVIAPGVYLRILTQMMQPTQSTTGACQGFQPKAQMLAMKQLAFLPGAREGNLVPRLPNAAEKAELDRMTDAVIADLAACAGANSAPSSIGAVSAMLQQLSPAAAEDPNDPSYAAIRAGMLEIEKQVDTEMPSASLSDKLLRADALVREDLIALRAEEALNIARIRVYDFEEDADDAAVRVLGAIGANPQAIGGFALSMLSPQSKAACLADVAASKPIGFGELYDVHPLPCWRYYHAQQFAKALDTCGVTLQNTAKRGPLKTHLPVITFDPADVAGIPQR